MRTGEFYFLTDDYCDKYRPHGVMNNKEKENGRERMRPCFYAVKDKRNENIFWMIPISSKIEKYERIMKEKLKKYPVYDGLEFGYVRGRKAAFLLQNMCPVSNRHVAEVYIDCNNGMPVQVSKKVQDLIRRKVHKIINLTEKGHRVTITDIKFIYDDIINN